MKKNVILLAAMMIASFASAQVGINTPTPTSTLDIVAKNATPTSIDGLLVPRVDRQRALNMGTGAVTVPVSTLIYVNSIANGSQAGNAVNIDETGYYYFDETGVWTKLKTPAAGAAADINIYKDNGTLLTDRIVAQADKTLAFTSTATTGTNHFSVDGNTFSVDAVNNRVGIGTITPASNTHIINNGASAGIGAGTATNTALILENPTNGKSVISAMKTKNSTGVAKEIWMGINPTFNTDAGIFSIGSTAGAVNGININLANSNVGIGTTTPTQTLDVNGGVRINNLPNAGLADRAVYAGSNGVLKVSNSSTANRVIWGVVRPNADDTVTIINSGSGGWAATRNGTGTVIITVTAPFSTPPAANAIQYLSTPISTVTNTTFPKASPQDNAGIDNVSLNQVQMWACDSVFNRADRVISFSITGF